MEWETPRPARRRRATSVPGVQASTPKTLSDLYALLTDDTAPE